MKDGLREVLISDGTEEAVDRGCTHRGGLRSRGRWERSTVDHRVADVDPGRPTVDDDAPDGEFERAHQPVCRLGVLFVHLQCRSQLSFELCDDRLQLVSRVVAYDEGNGAEDLILQLPVRREVLDRGREHAGSGRIEGVSVRPLRQ